MRIKQPDEIVQFSFDFSAMLASGETVASHVVTSTAGIAVTSSVDGSKILCNVSEGADGYLYEVRGSVVTSSNRQYSARETVLVTNQAPTLADVDDLRKIIGDSANAYSFDELRTILFDCALGDITGEPPFVRETNKYGVQVVNLDWIPTFDFNLAASRIWARKANDVIEKYDFSADGGNYSRSQLYNNYMKMSRHYASRRSPRAVKLQPSPSKRGKEGLDG